MDDNHSNQNTEAVQNELKKLPVWEKIGYSLGDTASNLFFQTFIYFMPIFYTDVFGITTKAAGTMFIITKFWDAKTFD